VGSLKPVLYVTAGAVAICYLASVLPKLVPAIVAVGLVVALVRVVFFLTRRW
jgi:hypothetical protein